MLLFDEAPYPGCKSCPENLLLVTDDQTVQSVLETLLGFGGVAMLAGVGFVLVRRWRRSGPMQRRALAPVAWTGAAVAVAGLASIVPQLMGDEGLADVSDTVLIGLITAVPFAFLAGLLRSSISRAGALGALMERVGTADVRDALAGALGDPGLELAFWLPARGEYVDADGHRADLSGRAVTEIEHDGEKVAAIVHDPALLDEPELVRAAGAAAALALHNQRLDAELRARYEELRASRARLVAAGDDARRRIERDLHDGAQQHLVSLALTLRLARLATEDGTKAAGFLDAGIDALKLGLAELRELARGIHPAVLTERGLEAALHGLAARAPVPVTVTADLGSRLEPAYESAAYFLVSEALTNVAKYAEATSASVTVGLDGGQRGHRGVRRRQGRREPPRGIGVERHGRPRRRAGRHARGREPGRRGHAIRARLPYRAPVLAT